MFVALAARGESTTEDALHAVDPHLDETLTSFLAAITRSDTNDALKAVLAPGGRDLIRASLPGGYTPMHVASCTRAAAELVRIFLELGDAPLDRVSKSGATPLFFAAWSTPEAVQLLLNAGADGSSVNLDGGSALSCAVWRGYQDAVAALLTAGANPRITNSSFGHPLYWAATQGNTEIMRMILDAAPGTLNLQTGAYGIGSNDPAFAPDQANIPAVIRFRRSLRGKSFYLGRTALHAAASKKRQDAVEFLLQRGADVTVADRGGDLPLHDACVMTEGEEDSERSREIVARLIHAGSPLDQRNKEGIPPILFAVWSKDSALVRLLAEGGANLNASDEEGQTALHHAAGNGPPSIIETLINLGANPEAENTKGFRPLAIAVSFGTAEEVAALLSGGAAADGFDTVRRTPLFLLLGQDVRDQERKLELLLEKGATINHRDKDGNTALMAACIRGDESIVRLLLARTADPNQSNEDSTFPLHAAVVGGHDSIVQILLEHGAAVDATDKIGETAAHEALRHERHDALEVLLDAGADPWTTDNDGDSPVVRAALSGKAALCSAVLRRLQPDLAAPSRRRDALVCAAAVNDEKLVEALLEAGASPNGAAPRNWRPIAAAALRGHEGIVSQLLSAGAQVNWLPGSPTALVCAAMGGHLSLVSRMLDAKANPNQPGPDGKTPLHFAVTNSHGEVVRTLLSAGASVNIAARDGASPLHAAARIGSQTIGKKLLRENAGVDALDEDGNTPLHFAAAEGNDEFVKLLLEAGAAPDLINQSGETPLFMAVGAGHAKCVELLLSAHANPRHINSGGQSVARAAATRRHGDILDLLVNAGADRPSPQPQESERASFLGWERLTDHAIDDFLALARGDLSALGIEPEAAGYLVAPLSFYRDASIVAVSDPKLTNPNERFFIWSRIPRLIVRLNWSNEPIYSANEPLSLHIDEGNVREYVRFFFFFVRGQSGRFVIVEPGDALPWLVDPPNRDRVMRDLRPVSVKEVDPKGLIVVDMTVVFKNALFATECFVAVHGGSFMIPGNAQVQLLSSGELSLANEQLLHEELPFIIDLPSTEFG